MSVIALAAPGIAAANSGSSAGARFGRPLGLVPPTANGTPAAGTTAGTSVAGTTSSASGPTKVDNLTYNGPDQPGNGPVMRTNTVYTIFWVPSGYSSFPSGYRATVNQFFADVAADSGTTSNVYSSDVQYSDTTGKIAYASTYGGTATDTHAVYASDCTTPGNVTGATVCMSDDTLQKEVKRFADAKGWPHGPNVEFFLYTTHNIETCFYTDAEAAVQGGNLCAYDYYCAYHNAFTATSQEYIYANMPFPNQSTLDSSRCYSVDQGLPNSGGAGPGTDAAAADEAINLTSHEHNESITDPLGNAWWVDNVSSAYWNQENGDLCAWRFPAGAVIGGSGTSSYNQVIDGHHYSVQGEWSNASATNGGSSGCVWSYTAVPANTASPTVSGSPAVGQLLTGDAGTWANTPTSYAYHWLRCNSSGTGCTEITSSTSSSTSTTYTVVSADAGHTIKLRVIADNALGSSIAASSNPTAVVVAGKPVNSARPAVTGTAAVGNTLTGTAGTWTNTPSSYKYEWLRCNSSGTSCTVTTTVNTAATTSTYTVVSADGTHTIKLRVTATNAAGSSTPSVSTPTAVVSATPANTAAPTISGTASQGQTLTGHAGTWTNSPTSYTYQWVRCNSSGTSCTAIVSSTTSSTTATYTVAAADASRTIKLRVTAKNAAGSSATAHSSATALVA